MLNKLLGFIRRYDMIAPGDRVVCAVSGGADSVALLFAMYLLKDKLDIHLSAAHFNHGLRGAESDRDEQFVVSLCDRYDIPLYRESQNVTAGKKGLEAAARDARYAFLRSLPGKIATAHTADDNAETVLMHLVRGTGLRGLGGIAPVNGTVIRPMLTVTRQEVEGFLKEWGLSWIQDSSNESDAFLRNRLRHHVMPLLKEENPRLAENLSRMALRLRVDSDCLDRLGESERSLRVDALKAMHPAVRSRVLEDFLKKSGVREPEAVHISRAEALAFSEKPSAKADFPGNVVISRKYDMLELQGKPEKLCSVQLKYPGSVESQGWRITCLPAEEIHNTEDTFTVDAMQDIRLRSRQPGDSIRLEGGTKLLKKLFIDRKIPQSSRDSIPVLADEKGILGVWGIGVNQDRKALRLPAVLIKIEKLT